MIIQLQWQYKNGDTKFIASKDIKSIHDLISFVKTVESQIEYPKGAVLMLCTKRSEFFAKEVIVQ